MVRWAVPIQVQLNNLKFITPKIPWTLFSIPIVLRISSVGFFWAFCTQMNWSKWLESSMSIEKKDERFRNKGVSKTIESKCRKRDINGYPIAASNLTPSSWSIEGGGVDVAGKKSPSNSIGRNTEETSLLWISLRSSSVSMSILFRTMLTTKIVWTLRSNSHWRRKHDWIGSTTMENVGRGKPVQWHLSIALFIYFFSLPFQSMNDTTDSVEQKFESIRWTWWNICDEIQNLWLISSKWFEIQSEQQIRRQRMFTCRLRRWNLV